MADLTDKEKEMLSKASGIYGEALKLANKFYDTVKSSRASPHAAVVSIHLLRYLVKNGGQLDDKFMEDAEKFAGVCLEMADAVREELGGVLPRAQA